MSKGGRTERGGARGGQYRVGWPEMRDELQLWVQYVPDGTVTCLKCQPTHATLDWECRKAYSNNGTDGVSAVGVGVSALRRYAREEREMTWRVLRRREQEAPMKGQREGGSVKESSANIQHGDATAMDCQLESASSTSTGYRIVLV